MPPTDETPQQPAPVGTPAGGHQAVRDVAPDEPGGGAQVVPHAGPADEVDAPPPVHARPFPELATVADSGVDPYAVDDFDEAPAEPEEEPFGPPPSHRLRLLRRLLGKDSLDLDATPRARLTGWLWCLAVTAFAGVLRFVGLGRPRSLVFDETYYVKDAYSLLTHGYEANWSEGANPAFESGDPSMLRTDAEYVVHPQVGKWMIAIGMRLGGGMDSSAAWRLAAAICGTIAVLMIARIARRMFASTAWGVVAGVFLALDGEAISMSRVSLLDPFLMFFVLAAFGCLLLDRERYRRDLAARAAAALDAGLEPTLTFRVGSWRQWRWWRLAAAVLLGLAIGTKWSGAYFLVVFALLSAGLDVAAWRSVGIRQWYEWRAIGRTVLTGASMLVVATLVYVGSWFSWFVHPEAWGRQWAAQNVGQGAQWLPESLRSLLHYHQEMWAFHNGLTTAHSYAAHPLGWIVQFRPTSFYYPTEVSTLTGQAAQDACGAASCSAAITALGNPILWWAGAAAIVVAVLWMLRYRDWLAVASLSGIVAGWLPWFAYAHRTIFTFYSVAFVPWVVLTLVYVLRLIVGPDDGDPGTRRAAIRGAAVLVGLVVVVGLFFYPIWAGLTVPYQFWHLHMWLPSWI